MLVDRPPPVTPWCVIKKTRLGNSTRSMQELAPAPSASSFDKTRTHVCWGHIVVIVFSKTWIEISRKANGVPRERIHKCFMGTYTSRSTRDRSITRIYLAKTSFDEILLPQS